LGDAESAILDGTMSGGYTHVESAAAQMVEDGGLLGQLGGVVKGKDIDPRADPRVRGPFGQDCEEDRNRGAVAVVGEEVLLNVEGVEAEPFGLGEQEEVVLP